ncbi:MAG: GNAT family N-acetyltransferase [Rikenellaceae bacterium]
MKVLIKSVETRKELKRFIKFPNKLYKGNKYYIPSLLSDDLITLNPKKNPAFDFCEAKFFMAFKGGKAVGRIAGIINYQVNNREKRERVRFGYVDFIDDNEVVDALFSAVENWGKSKGMNQINGPLGFSDMDPEGMLVEGFDKIGTMVAIYNHEYYPKQLERLGFAKEADWVEYLITIPEQVPERHNRVSEIVSKKFSLRTLNYTSRKKLARDYGQKLFKLVNEAYDTLYGYSPLSERQIQHYVKLYLPMLKLNNLILVVDSNDDLVGMAVGMPSIAKALQKSRGRLFPFGFIHLLKALKGKNNTVELLLMAVKPEYQNKGVSALLFSNIINSFNSNGYRYAESNPELEVNLKMQNQWQDIENQKIKRRRAFIKNI